MTELAPWVIPLAASVAGIGGLLVLWTTVRAIKSEQPGSRSRSIVHQMTCSVCSRELLIGGAQLTPLSNAERALSVRIRPDLTGQPLAEYVCPYCEASHCFVVSKRTMTWVGANLYLPQAAVATCFECKCRLRKPPWPKGAFDGRLDEVPALSDDIGLVCDRCRAHVCMACAKRATRVRAPGEPYKCPRCTRQGLNEVFHF